MCSPLRLLLVVIGVVLFAAVADGQSPRTQAQPGAPRAPARDTKTAAVGTGVIKGRIVAAGGAPLRRARAMLSAAALSRPLYTATDAQGRYEFTELPGGRYTLTVSKGSYVTMQYGQRRAFESGKPIELADAATLEKIDMTLPKGGVISGTVVDDMGEPIAGASVSAFRSRYREGKRTLVAIGQGVQTNDLGQYRVYGLQPGSYYIGTRAQPAAMSDGYPFAPSYYPATLNVAEAQRVTVGLAQERSGIDLIQPPGRLARVSGVALGAAGGPLSDGSVSIVSPASGHVLSATVRSDGAFSIPDISPGEYVLAASLIRSDGVQMAALPLTITGEDVEGVVLQLTAGARLTGRVVMDDGTAPRFPHSAVKVDPFPLASDMPVRIQNIGLQGLVKDDWSFEMNGIGGRLLLRTSSLPAGCSLKAVLLDRRDITDAPLDLRASEEITGVQVVLTANVTEVNGSPIDGKGAPVSDYAFVVFADDPTLWKYPSRFLATARPDQQGRFRVVGLPPGRYLAVALDYLEEGQSEDPDYLETLRALATGFTLEAGEKKSLALKVTKAEGL